MAKNLSPLKPTPFVRRPHDLLLMVVGERFLLGVPLWWIDPVAAIVVALTLPPWGAAEHRRDLTGSVLRRY